MPTGIISRKEDQEASSLPPAVSLSPLRKTLSPARQLVVWQHSLKKPVVQPRSSQQCSLPPGSVLQVGVGVAGGVGEREAIV